MTKKYNTIATFGNRDPHFEVGDKVRILDGSAADYYAGGWIEDLDSLVGEVVTIKKWNNYVKKYDTYSCGVEEYCWTFDERFLEKIKEPSRIDKLLDKICAILTKEG